MASRLGWFVLGIIGAIVLFSAGTYAFVRGGGVPMATTAAPLPLESTLSDTERWQVTMLMAHVDKLPAAVQPSVRF